MSKKQKFLRSIIIDKEEKKLLIKDTKSAIKKINKLIRKKKISYVVVSKTLYSIKNQIECHKLDGTKLFSFLIYDAIQYICKLSKKSMETMQISILVNENNEINNYNIISIAKNVKRLNIITNKAKQFLRLQDYLYNNFGILLKISNNKKSDLISSDIIINEDFGKEINSYNINYKAIVLNINNPVDIEDKKFNGINIKGYDINCPREYHKEGFDNKFVYESIIYKNDLSRARKRILEDNIHIDNFIGSKGIIPIEEFITI